jgi:hypothetical protein
VGSCYEDCTEDAEDPSLYKRACKQIKRQNGVVNSGCGWQLSSATNKKKKLFDEILNSQNTDKVGVDECSSYYGGEGLKTFAELCENAKATKFPRASMPSCKEKMRQMKLTSVCFCSSDYCNSDYNPNSGNYLKSSFFLIFSILMKQLLV